MSRLRLSEVYRDSGLGLTVLESIGLQSYRGDSSVHAYVQITPLALLIEQPGHHYAVDMEGTVLSLARLRQTYPALDRLLKETDTDTFR